MITTANVYDFIDGFAPFDSALGFDNVGLLVGSKDKKVTRILVTLDVTDAAIREAEENGCELIVSHHPVIFNPLRSVEPDDFVWSLIKKDIAVISAHTNLDMAKGGVNDCFSRRTGMTDVSELILNGAPLGRVGKLKEEIPFDEYVKFIRDAFDANAVRFVKSRQTCKKIASVCGSGGDAVDAAVLAGADTLITGEAKYNHFLDAARKKVNLIEVGHYSSENVCMPYLRDKLAEKFPDVEVFLCKSHREFPDVYAR